MLIDEVLCTIPCDKCRYSTRTCLSMVIHPIDNVQYDPTTGTLSCPTGYEKVMTCDYSCSNDKADVVIEGGHGKCYSYMPRIITCDKCIYGHKIETLNSDGSITIYYVCNNEPSASNKGLYLTAHKPDYYCGDAKLGL